MQTVLLLLIPFYNSCMKWEKFIFIHFLKPPRLSWKLNGNKILNKLTFPEKKQY